MWYGILTILSVIAIALLVNLAIETITIDKQIEEYVEELKDEELVGYGYGIAGIRGIDEETSFINLTLVYEDGKEEDVLLKVKDRKIVKEIDNKGGEKNRNGK